MAWPAEEEEDPSLADGTQLNLTVIGETTTDTAGHYAMHVYDNQDLSAGVTSEGTVNAELDAYNGDTLSSTTAVSLDPSAAQSGTAGTSAAPSGPSSSAANSPDAPTSEAPSDDPSATDSAAPSSPAPTTSAAPTSAGPTPTPTKGCLSGCVHDPAPLSADASSTSTAAAPQNIDLDGTQQPDNETAPDSTVQPACCGSADNPGIVEAKATNS